MDNIILKAKGITKLFPGVKALDSVDFDLKAGEVHIIVGENGAGKSTLAKVLLGAYKPEEGEIFLNDKKVIFNNTKDGLNNGIVAVYQEFTLVPFLNVAQNIFLNREYRNRIGLINNKNMENEAKKILNELNCNYIDVKTLVKNLNIAEQQIVEIAKALSFNPKIIVFDEPTSALSEREVKSLFTQIRKLKKEGIGIIYVSHKMGEFSLIGDRITVLRDGIKIQTLKINEKSNEELVNLMVGRTVSQIYYRTENKYNEEALRAENLNDKMGRVIDANIHVNKGEIVGIAGLVGSGRTELAQLIFGINPIKSGHIYIKGKDVKIKSPIQAVKMGIGLVSEDRKRYGLELNSSIAWNIISVSIKKYFPKLFISYIKICGIAEKYRVSLRIISPNVYKQCKYLSGGNQQKVVLAKWLSSDTNIFIFDEPTRGIDVGAKMEICNLMNKLATEGKAIIMISSELVEVIGMSDRLYIMNEGKMVKECKRDEFNSEQIGAFMLGVGGENFGK